MESRPSSESRLVYLGDSHAILSAVRELIASAQHSIILQMYLFANDGDLTSLLPRPHAFPYAKTVASWLVEKKRQSPALPIVVVLDSNTPANPQLSRRRGTLIRTTLRRAGIIVLNANLFTTEFVRHRRFLSAMNFHLHHEKVALPDWVERQNRWQSLHNVEDHRKNLVIDGGRAGAITSHNFFDASFDWHENMFWLIGDVARQLWRIATAAVESALTLPQDLTAEEKLLLQELLGGAGSSPPEESQESLTPTGAAVPEYPLARTTAVPALTPDPDCALIENKSIRKHIVALLRESTPADEILVATAYFSDSAMLAEIASALARGVRVRVLIDSLHALPMPPLSSWLICSLVNHAVRSAAQKLHERYPEQFQLRIHQSQPGAMMHLKTVARRGAQPLLIGGQANFTPNSFSGAYLETDLVTGAPAVVAAYEAHFASLWTLPQSIPLSRPRGVMARLRLGFYSLLLWLFALLGLRP